MKRYILKLLFFIIPFVLIFAIIFIVDPYNFINISHIIDDDDKIKVYRRSDAASPRGTLLWKALEFKRKPVKNIIIGDSQGTSINDSLIKELTGEDYFNFCCPGSSYLTMFDCFWYCVENSTPKNVYFQIGFMNYSASRSYNIFHFAQDYFDKPYLYFITKEILLDSYYNIIFSITQDSSLVYNTHEYYTLEKQNQLSKESLKKFFKNYSYPTEYFIEFQNISNYCSENNIKLNFIILPVYKEVNDYLETQNLQVMNDKFKHDINSLGATFDYTIDMEISKQRNNFYDYFHPKDHIVNQIVLNIWSE